MKKEEMRVLSARNPNPLSSTMPIGHLDSDFPLQKRRSVDYSIKGRSIYKSEKPDPSDQEAYSELKLLYEKALTENFSLKGENNHESSFSTVKLDKESNLKLSLATEHEEANELISNTMVSVMMLKDYYTDLVNSKTQAKKELDEMRAMHSFAKDNMISLLQGKLNNTVDMLKTVYRDKKNLESLLDKEEKSKHLLQAQNTALEEKIKVFEGRNKEVLSVGQLTSQISNTLSKQEALNKKIEKYETYIQSKLKKS
jgi:hypothetical protein